MSNLQTYYHFKLDFQKVDQHTGGKWLIHGTKRRKDNQLQSLELPCKISTLEQRTPKHKSDWLNGYGVLLTNVQCHRYLYSYHDIEITGTYNWNHTWNHTVSNHPIHQYGHTNFWYVCLLERVYFN